MEFEVLLSHRACNLLLQFRGHILFCGRGAIITLTSTLGDPCMTYGEAPGNVKILFNRKISSAASIMIVNVE